MGTGQSRQDEEHLPTESRNSDRQIRAVNGNSNRIVKDDRTNNHETSRRQKIRDRRGKTDSTHGSVEQTPEPEEDALESKMQEIVATVDAVDDAEEKKTKKRSRFRNFFGAKNTNAHSAPAPEANNRSAPCAPDVVSTTSAPTLASRSRANGKLPHRPGTRHGRLSMSEEQISTESDWEYQKVAIDGFDPEKFKKANVSKLTISSTAAISNLPLGTIDDFGSISNNNDPLLLRIRQTEKQKMAVPPAYDITEEQLMSSIENEYKL